MLALKLVAPEMTLQSPVHDPPEVAPPMRSPLPPNDLDAEALIRHRRHAGLVGTDVAAEDPHLVGVDEDAVVGGVVDDQVADDRAEADLADGEAVVAADRRSARSVQLDALPLGAAIDGHRLR